MLYVSVTLIISHAPHVRIPGSHLVRLAAPAGMTKVTGITYLSSKLNFIQKVPRSVCIIGTCTAFLIYLSTFIQ